MMQLAKSSANPLKRCFQTMMMNHGSFPNDNNIIIKHPKLIEVENATAPFVSHKYSFYQPSKVDHMDLKVKLESSRFKFEVPLFEMQISLQNNHKDSDERHAILRKRLSNDHSIITSCIDELGLLCAFEAVKFCISNTLQAVEEECEFFQEIYLQCFYFLKDALCIVEKCLPNGHENIFNAGCDYEKMVSAGYISPKLYQLFCLFQSFGEATKVSCLIFVETVITAKVLDIIVKRVADLSHLEVSYLTSEGTSVDAMSMKLQKETLESLCSGKVNVLVFATDVVDMPKCSTVICFDIPKTARSNVQSRGWASQSASQFITMLERGNAKQREHICDVIQSKHSLLDSPQIQDPDTSVVNPKNFKQTELHYVEVTATAAKSTEERPSGAGTTKRKELHGTTPIRAITGTWGVKNDDGVDFFAYKISFKCSIDEVIYSSFVLLVASKLADDVANIDMELYLVSKYVNCKVSSCVEELHLTAEQVAKGKSFQELFFNGIFGKLYIGSKQSEHRREFLLQTDRKLWNPSYMFLLLPLESLEPFKINWKEIDSSASVVEFVKKYCLLRADNDNGSMDTIMADSDCQHMVHFANTSIHKDSAKDVVVLAIHTGKIYSVLELLQDETARNPFHGDTEQFSSYMDYFKVKYEIDLKYPGQNMLLLKQSHRAHNLLVDFNGEGILHGKKIRAGSCKVNTNKQRYYARIPPEILVIIEARTDVVRSFYLLPSLMNRLESLMLASQLREEINGHPADLRISASLILEAITTLRCNESFSMERLEFLGDSVLKYVVSCDLYLKYAKKHEGQLSTRRSWQVCNSTLYKLGISRYIQGYIRDSAFDPTRWTAPGQLPLKPYPCDHDIETMEVPIHPKYQSEDPRTITGKSCDTGHRWLGSKTVSDCVEALVGAYFVDGGLTGALQCMRWLGISCELDPACVNEALQNASLHAYTPKLDILQCLESKLGYQFVVKGLLLEAITHASDQDRGVGFCYERLEFLGDSVLDLLITRYLYNKHTDIYPGELTDLRSASVSNENFAYAAVRRDIHLHLQHHSSYLQGQIEDYVKFVATSSTDTNSFRTKKSPKALGDLVESITGAILVDAKLNLDEVWRIVEPLLSPIVTPDKLELPPLRELMEWCDLTGYFTKEEYRPNGEDVTAKLGLQLKDALLIGEGTGSTRKIARGQAALKLLRELEKRGMLNKTQREDNKDMEIDNQDNNKDLENRDGETADQNTKDQMRRDRETTKKNSKDQVKREGETENQTNIISDTTSKKPDSDRNTKITLFDPQPSTNASIVDECSTKAAPKSKLEISVLKSINMKKGGPRSSLFDLCKKMQWPMPSFTPTEQKSTSLMEIGEGANKRATFNTYQSLISLTIPGYCVVELTGHAHADKKSSYDSAALLMLYELQKLGKLKVG